MKRRVLAVGDIIGSPGMRAVFSKLPALKKKHNVDLTIVNAENAAEGFGLTPELANTIYASGADVITSGNHIWEQQDIYKYLQDMPTLLRPANYPVGCPGKGACVYASSAGRGGKALRYLVVNVQGRERMWNIDCPFAKLDEVLRKFSREADLVIVDVHAESPEEKEALAYHVDGRATLVFGTHTHIQTSDARILPKGTAYLTDIGATGPAASVIGFEPEPSIERLISYIPHKLQVAESEPELRGVVMEFDDAEPLRALSLETLVA